MTRRPQRSDRHPGTPRTVTVYSRAGCHLCEQAIAVVEAAVDPSDTVTVVDIDADPALYERYTVRVPVVAVDDIEVAEYQVTPEQLRAALRSGPQL